MFKWAFGLDIQSKLQDNDLEPGPFTLISIVSFSPPRPFFLFILPSIPFKRRNLRSFTRTVTHNDTLTLYEPSNNLLNMTNLLDSDFIITLPESLYYVERIPTEEEPEQPLNPEDFGQPVRLYEGHREIENQTDVLIREGSALRLWMIVTKNLQQFGCRVERNGQGELLLHNALAIPKTEWIPEEYIPIYKPYVSLDEGMLVIHHLGRRWTIAYI